MTFIGENQPKLKQLANWFTWYTGKQHPSADFLDCRMQCHVHKNSPAGMVSSKPQGLRNVTLMIPSWSRSTPLMIPLLSGKASHQDSSKKSIVKSTVLVSTFETCWQKKTTANVHTITQKKHVHEFVGSRHLSSWPSALFHFLSESQSPWIMKALTAGIDSQLLLMAEVYTGKLFIIMELPRCSITVGEHCVIPSKNNWDMRA